MGNSVRAQAKCFSRIYFFSITGCYLDGVVAAVAGEQWHRRSEDAVVIAIDFAVVVAKATLQLPPPQPLVVDAAVCNVRRAAVAAVGVQRRLG